MPLYEKKIVVRKQLTVFVTEQFLMIQRLLYWDIMGYNGVFCIVLNWKLLHESLKRINFKNWQLV